MSSKTEDIYAIVNEIHREYLKLREEALWDSLLIVTKGKIPTTEEIQNLGMRKIYPKGRVEWFYGDRLLLKEPAISFNTAKMGLKPF